MANTVNDGGSHMRAWTEVGQTTDGGTLYVAARWYACEYPERPPEHGLTMYHNPDWGDPPCRGCYLALKTSVLHAPDHVGTAHGQPKKIADMLAEMEAAGWRR